MSNTQTYPGQQGTPGVTSKFNSIMFAIRQTLGLARTLVPMKIIKVYGGGVSSIPTYDASPVVNSIDAIMQSTPHDTVYGIQGSRNQGGSSAHINDHVAGDVVLVAVCDRDISSLKKNNGAVSNPGSYRRHDMADGVVVAKMFSPTAPTNYILHKPGGGFTIQDQFGNIWDSSSSGITVTCETFQVNGKIQATGEIVAKNASTNIHVTTHTHASGPPPDPGS